jgi:uncharacterized protein (DUF983 family)
MATSVESARLPNPAPGLIFRRALRLRCPLCGGGPVLLGWFTVAPSCPSCGLHLDRDEPGYWVGSYTVNLFLTEGVLGSALLIGLLATWPAVPWTALSVTLVVLALSVPVLVLPLTKVLYLAIDLAFRPVEDSDLSTPHEAGLAKRGPH